VGNYHEHNPASLSRGEIRFPNVSRNYTATASLAVWLLSRSNNRREQLNTDRVSILTLFTRNFKNADRHKLTHGNRRVDHETLQFEHTFHVSVTANGKQMVTSAGDRCPIKFLSPISSQLFFAFFFQYGISIISITTPTLVFMTSTRKRHELRNRVPTWS